MTNTDQEILDKKDKLLKEINIDQIITDLKPPVSHCPQFIPKALYQKLCYERFILLLRINNYLKEINKFKISKMSTREKIRQSVFLNQIDKMITLISDTIKKEKEIDSDSLSKELMYFKLSRLRVMMGHPLNINNDDAGIRFLTTPLLILVPSLIICLILTLSLQLPAFLFIYMFIVTLSWALVCLAGWNYFADNSDINDINIQISNYNKIFIHSIRPLSEALKKFDSDLGKLGLDESFKQEICHFIVIALDSDYEEINEKFSHYCQDDRFTEEVIDILNRFLESSLSETIKKELTNFSQFDKKTKCLNLLSAFKLDNLDKPPAEPGFLSSFRAKDTLKPLNTDMKNSITASPPRFK